MELILETTLFCVLLLVGSGIDNVDGGHAGFCASVVGYSLGSRHFCKGCSNRNGRGLSVFWTGPKSYWGNSARSSGAIHPDLTLIEVTAIEIDKKVLSGWFHIHVKFPNPKDLELYAFILQVEDTSTRRAIGEFTTELKCGDVDVKETPTQVQILPCQATPLNQALHPNSVVYWRGAKDTDGVIRTKTLTEFHANWKIPPGSACSHPKVFVVRATVLTTNKTAKGVLEKCMDEKDCRTKQPNSHTHLRTMIVLPDLTPGKAFHSPAPLPVFLSSSTEVNCKVPILNEKSGPPRNLSLPFLKFQEVSVGCDGDDAKARRCNPQDPAVVCTLGASYKQINEKEDTSNELARELYLGRCLEEGGEKAVTVGANRGLKCALPPADPEYKEDNEFVDGLETAEEYLRNYKYDLCNCSELLQTEGSVRNFSVSQDSTSTPPPDYPTVSVDLEATGSGTESPPVTISYDQLPHPLLGTPNGTKYRDVAKSYLEIVQRGRSCHGCFCAVAFLIFIPIAIVICRYWKESFYGTTLILYDLYYALHATGAFISLTFLTVGMICVLVLDENHDINSSVLPHGTIGWALVVMCVLMTYLGGIRCFPNSKNLLMTSIYAHGIIGYLIYYVGLASMMLFSFGSQIEEHMIAVLLIIVRIVVDIIFHIVMTVHVKVTDRKYTFRRGVIPVMELIIDDRNAPGRKFKIIMVVLYALTSLVLGIVYMVSITLAEYSMTSYAVQVPASPVTVIREHHM